MVLKSAFVAAVCTVLLALGGVAFADEYRPSEFFGLDLSTAVLSPKRLGPPAQFEPVAVEANSERRNDAQASVEPKVVQPQVKLRKPVRTTRVMAPAEQPRKIARVPARAKLARRHTNPLDAEARDIRIQTWPCKSGGICGWRR
ncbi:signal peptide protein [Bradyrhizobium sp. LTSPM299]|uniref:hypothetical protein n=1 Tax=Bradyrhizobium sp. LTSPM299 TaxID=1619233 RepID=UPI0005C91890|nr:hypothetical protein [Bradyrhizobium sp. LTSPM299]KJC60695.1 signal peptide protein [Bradyrhizobium sp. LTSPM299]